MIRNITLFLFLLLPFFKTLQLQAQPKPYPVYLIGNSANQPVPEQNYRLLKQDLDQLTSPFTIVHLGDIVAEKGWPENPTEAQKLKLQQLLDLVKDKPNGKLIFVPGDRDWANSGKDGMAAVRRLEKFISDRLPYKNAFVPGQGCPGPEVLDVS
ncbi:MAG TPA: hypothetical protein VK927_11410, partial [Adhaeribacter sp.]|nr:hypothetical protein [Adhaeribacter sp.]